MLAGALKRTPVVIDGASHFLCGDFAQLVRAEAFFNEMVHDVNLAGAIMDGRRLALAIHDCAG